MLRRFVDTLAVLGDAGSTHDSSRRLDYIFARGLTATAGGVLREVDTSDHYPLWTTLTVD
jgi:endonuclease/exonuclease/phosphatase (EEP) superfamily protein YafD